MSALASILLGRGVPIQLSISTVVGETPDENELVALRDWLLQETPRPAGLDLAREAPQPGNMGTAFDALQVAVGAGGALTVLAGSISTWLATRRQDVALKLTRSDGEVLRVAGRVKDPSVLIEAFLSAAGADEPGDPVSDSQER